MHSLSELTQSLGLTSRYIPVAHLIKKTGVRSVKWTELQTDFEKL